MRINKYGISQENPSKANAIFTYIKLDYTNLSF